MKRFSQYLRKQGRWLVFATACLMAYSGIDANNYVYAADTHLRSQQRNAEFLAKLAPKDGVAGGARVRTSGSRHEQESRGSRRAAVLEVAERIKNRHKAASVGRIENDLKAIERLEGVAREAGGEVRLTRLMQLEAHLRSLQRGLADGVLAPLPDGLPRLAVERHERAERDIERSAKKLLSELGELARQKGAGNDDRKARTSSLARSATSDPSRVLDIARATSEVAARERQRIHGRSARRQTTPERPLPLRPLETRPIERLQVTEARRPRTRAASMSAVAPATRTAATCPNAASPQELQDLVETLGCSAVKIFNFVHDGFEFEPYYGVAKGWKTTLDERRGNDFDQALLLEAMLEAAGFDARLEWGSVDLPIEQATNLTGVDDASEAGSLLVTAGYPAVLLVSPSGPVGIRMTHAWVKAFVDYIPDRGAMVGGGDPDTWVRLDPALKQYSYTAGIPLNGESGLEFSYLDYVSDPDHESPLEFFGEKIRQHFLANGTRCETLRQVWKEGSIVAAKYPYLPDTFPATIVSVLDEAESEFPGTFDHTVSIALEDEFGDEVVSYSGRLADLHRGRLSLTFPCAGQADCDTISAFGSLWTTPAYLVNLRPTLKLEETVIAAGPSEGVGAGTAHALRMTFAQPNVPTDQTVHEVTAGETVVIGLDPGFIAAERIGEREQLLAALQGTADEDTILAEQLHIALLRYLRQLSDGFRWVAGLKQHRYVKRPVEGRTARLVDVAAVFGVPHTLTPVEHNIDVSRLMIGLLAIDGEVGYKREAVNLAGAQSSWLEGAVWEQTLNRAGISAVKALKLAKSNGQTLHEVNDGNVDAVLADPDVDLGAEEELISLRVHQGRVGLIASQPIELNNWEGTGYILEDPETGAATYPISGGTAGGSDTGGGGTVTVSQLGSEPWHGSGLQEMADLLEELGHTHTAGPPVTLIGDPVNIANGNFLAEITDLVIPTPAIAVHLTRTYNSMDDRIGPLGWNWTHNYNLTLEESQPGQIPGGPPVAEHDVLYRDDNGTRHIFVWNGASYDAPAGIHKRLTDEPAGWKLRGKDGSYALFNSGGQVLELGNEQYGDQRLTFEYDPNDRLVIVNDSGDRSVLTFTYGPDSLLETASDHTGRTYTYGYVDGNMTSVLDPDNAATPEQLHSTMVYDDDHHLVMEVSPFGLTTHYGYDTEGRVVSRETAVSTEFFYYDPVSRGTLIVDPGGYEHVVSYDAVGRAVRQVDPLGNEVVSDWDEDNNVLAVTDSRGATTSWSYDDSGNLLSETAPGMTGPLWVRAFETDPNAFSRLLTETDMSGNVRALDYTAAGRVIETFTSAEPGSPTVTLSEIEFDARGQITMSKDGEGGITELVWDPIKGSLETITIVDGDDRLVTTIESDAVGRSNRITDPLNMSIAMTLTARGVPEQMIDPSGNVVDFVYDADGRRERRTVTSNEPGVGPRVTQYHHDDGGRLVEVIDPLGRSQKMERDPLGQITARIDAGGNRTEYAYDALGRLTTMTDPYAKSLRVGSCAGMSGGGAVFSGLTAPGGAVCAIRDDDGELLYAHELDDRGRVRESRGGPDGVQRFEYDDYGRETAMENALGHRTEFTYDNLGRLASVVEMAHEVIADQLHTFYQYDNNGRITQVTDAREHDWTYEYNKRGLLTREVDPENNEWEYAYTAGNQLWVTRQPNGQGIKNDYDGPRLIGVRRVTGATLQDMIDDGGELVATFSYDASGRRTGMTEVGEVELSWTLDALNRVETWTNHTLGKTLTYDYWPNGGTRRVGSAEGDVDFFYDAKNRLVRLQDENTGTFGVTYDSLDRRTSVQLPNGLQVRYVYDANGRVESVKVVSSPDTVVQGFTYSYDDAGRRIERRELRDNQLIRTEEYGYDHLGRLARVGPVAAPTESFSYDEVGNRTGSATEAFTASYEYDNANRLEWIGKSLPEETGYFEELEFVHDGNGNLTSADNEGGIGPSIFEWDSRNRLTRVDLPTGSYQAFGYDPSGARVRVESEASSRRFLLAGANIVAEYSGELIDLVLEKSYTHGPGVDEPLARRVLDLDAPPGTDPYRVGYFLRDALGSITGVVDDQQALSESRAYLGFGGGEALPDGYGFSGRELDQLTGLMYYRARYYQPGLGRFLSADRLRGELRAPQSQNRYSYVMNMPTMQVDPLGLYAQLPADAHAWTTAVFGWNMILATSAEMTAVGMEGHSTTRWISELLYRYSDLVWRFAGSGSLHKNNVAMGFGIEFWDAYFTSERVEHALETPANPFHDNFMRAHRAWHAKEAIHVVEFAEWVYHLGTGTHGSPGSTVEHTLQFLLNREIVDIYMTVLGVYYYAVGNVP